MVLVLMAGADITAQTATPINTVSVKVDVQDVVAHRLAAFEHHEVMHNYPALPLYCLRLFALYRFLASN